MRAFRWIAAITAFTLPLLLSGCFLLATTRKLPIPVAPDVVQTATPQDLITQINDRWEKLQTLNATVDIQLSVTKSQQGVATNYTSVSSIILLRKPEMLRVYGKVPLLGTRMFDMVSDGKKFTLWIPSRNKAIEGSTTSTKKSANQMENLRPEFFFDAMVVRGVEADDDYSVAGDSETIEDAKHKRLLLTPEYVLSIMRRREGTHELMPARVLTIHRDDLLPYQQDLYDKDGTLVTQVNYSNYQKYDFGMYPGTIVIKRPLEDIQLTLTVEKVSENLPLTDDQFTVKPTAGTEIQSLE